MKFNQIPTIAALGATATILSSNPSEAFPEPFNPQDGTSLNEQITVQNLPSPTEMQNKGVTDLLLKAQRAREAAEAKTKQTPANITSSKAFRKACGQSKGVVNLETGTLTTYIGADGVKVNKVITGLGDSTIPGIFSVETKLNNGSYVGVNFKNNKPYQITADTILVLRNKNNPEIKSVIFSGDVGNNKPTSGFTKVPGGGKDLNNYKKDDKICITKTVIPQ